jgi:hypothetical protein
MAPSHRRRTNQPLPDIPEAEPSPPVVRPPPRARIVTPGANAFAQHAARVDKHRLESNAFYQQAVAKRTITPPTAIHPALRDNFDLNSSVPHVGPTGVHELGLCMMAPYTAPYTAPPTPPVLIPAGGNQALPTDRGVIEDKREQLLHESSGSDSERTPVFIYATDVDSPEFTSSATHATPKKKKAGLLDWATATEQTRSPKKGILEKLGLTTPRPILPTALSSTSVTSRGYHTAGENLPPKAKAVLSSPPPQANLTRTPSKKKAFFSRKISEQPSIGVHRAPTFAFAANEPRSAGAKTVTFADSQGMTPQTIHSSFSDPTHDHRMQPKRAASAQGGNQSQVKDSQDGVCGVSRSQSLQYFDRTVPPTPPAKNTPPHEKELKAKQKAAEKAAEIMEDHRLTSELRRSEFVRKMTPNKEEMEMMQKPESKLKSPLHSHVFDCDTPSRGLARLIGTDGRISPTRFGGYGRKDMPKLEKHPSVYSMHASFFPDLHDQYSFEEIKKSADGLGLEGLSELPESFYNREPKIVYSPSNYSEEFGARPESVVQTSPDTLHHAGMFKLPSLANHEPTSSNASVQEKKSGSSHGTIPLVYPDLASDPSRTPVINAARGHHRSRSDNEILVHSRIPSPSHRRSSPRKTLAEELAEAENGTPLSPVTYTCPSAKPSPLQFLPSTVYSPSRKTKVDVPQMSPTSTKTLTPSRSRGRIETFKSSGSPIARASTSPFDNLPTLPPSIKPSFDMSPPVVTTAQHPEPQKLDRGTSSISITSGKVSTNGTDACTAEQMTVMLRKMETQQQEIANLKAQLRSVHSPEPLTPSISSIAESNAVHPSASVADHMPLYIPDGGLSHMSLHHRGAQQGRVSEPYYINATAEARSMGMPLPRSTDRYDEIMEALGALTQQMLDLKGQMKQEN